MSFIGPIIAALGSIWFGYSLWDWIGYSLFVAYNAPANFPSAFVKNGIIFGPLLVIIGLILFLQDIQKDIKKLK